MQLMDTKDPNLLEGDDKVCAEVGTEKDRPRPGWSGHTNDYKEDG